jgi:hypothetical protein
MPRLPHLEEDTTVIKIVTSEGSFITYISAEAGLN